MSDIRVVAIDLDDTLFNDDKTIHPDNVKAINNLTKDGVKVVIASGRSPAGIIPTLDILNLTNANTYLISFNGAIIYDLKTKEILYKQTLKGRDIKEIYTLLPDGLFMHFYDINQKLYANVRNQFTTDGARLNNLDYEVIDISKINDDDDYIKLLFTGPSENVTSFINQLDSKYYDKFSLMRSSPIYFEFLPKGASKGKALEEIAKMDNLTRDNIMAIGDNDNDLAMIKFAKYGIAMENSLSKKVLENAYFITKKNSEAGVAFAINKFVYNKEA